jgi:hypothetical protein
VTGELALQAQGPSVIAGLDQFVHESGGGGEADRALGRNTPRLCHDPWLNRDFQAGL